MKEKWNNHDNDLGCHWKCLSVRVGMPNLTIFDTTMRPLINEMYNRGL